MKEQSRSRGLTYTYSYAGNATVKSFSCRMKELAQEHVLGLATAVASLVIGGFFLCNCYMRYYIKKEVLTLIRQHSVFDDVNSITLGIPTEGIFQLLLEKLVAKKNLPSLLLRKRITLEKVDEACHELLRSAEAGVHTYRMSRTNHWWAKVGNISLPRKPTEKQGTSSGWKIEHSFSKGPHNRASGVESDISYRNEHQRDTSDARQKRKNLTDSQSWQQKGTATVRKVRTVSQQSRLPPKTYAWIHRHPHSCCTRNGCSIGIMLSYWRVYFDLWENNYVCVTVVSPLGVRKDHTCRESLRRICTITRGSCKSFDLFSARVKP